MASDLVISPYPDIASADLIHEASVGSALDTSTNPEMHTPGVDMASRTPGPGFLGTLSLHGLATKIGTWSRRSLIRWISEAS